MTVTDVELQVFIWSLVGVMVTGSELRVCLLPLSPRSRRGCAVTLRPPCAAPSHLSQPRLSFPHCRFAPGPVHFLRRGGYDRLCLRSLVRRLKVCSCLSFAMKNEVWYCCQVRIVPLPTLSHCYWCRLSTLMVNG